MIGANACRIHFTDWKEVTTEMEFPLPFWMASVVAGGSIVVGAIAIAIIDRSQKSQNIAGIITNVADLACTVDPSAPYRKENARDPGGHPGRPRL
jgi:hypothetical protein